MNRRLCHVLWLGLCATLINCQVKLFGYQLSGLTLTRCHRMPMAGCHRECMARGACLSYSYYVSYKSCVLHREDASSYGATLTKTRGFVFVSKTSWSGSNSVCSPACSNTETCDQATATCKVTECALPSIGYNSYMKGNMYDTGSRVMHVCANNAYNVRQSTCLETGLWSAAAIQNYTGDLDGHWFRIHVVADNKFWHENGNGDKKVSVRYQPDDRWVRFQFQETNNRYYRIKVRTVFVYDGYSVPDASNDVLTSVVNLHPDSSKFAITQDSNGCLLMRTKRTGRLVRRDPDKLISSKYNIDDEWSKFYLIKL